MTNQTDTLHRNAQGHLVPESLIKTIDLLRDGVVRKQVAAAQALQLQMAAAKVQMQRELEDYLDLSAQEYGVTYGGAKGNITLTSYDGSMKVERAIGEHRIFDERIQAAKAQIDACIGRWSEGASANLVAMVDHAFRVNKQGRIDVNQVLSLRNLAIEDDEWKAAMDAIADAITTVSKKEYIRLYQREPSGKYVAINLDWAKL
ncbi:sulfate transporter [Aeromonas sp. ASNIH3]|uniref:DUF3164 family protein n=1 Tax=Aeromonas sp. ASNIH3 TaxID=1636608 RepID=UPI000CD1F30D|nr:DUF3164 family protein [Aeromonas sp. ASNIH3]AUV10735.1 sulfate transporter [Aeromonas sp. ASNIH3]